MVCTDSHAQEFKWDIAPQNFQRISMQGSPNWGWNGAGLGISRFFAHRPSTRIEAGAEYGFNGIAHYLFLKGGYHYAARINDTKWSYTAGGYVLQGAALFRQNPLYMGGAGITGSINFRVSDGLAIGFSAGIRWYISPAYGKYALSNRYLDLPIGLHFRF
jgi:hypothetical protein